MAADQHNSKPKKGSRERQVKTYKQDLIYRVPGSMTQMHLLDKQLS